MSPLSSVNTAKRLKCRARACSVKLVWRIEKPSWHVEGRANAPNFLPLGTILDQARVGNEHGASQPQVRVLKHRHRPWRCGLGEKIRSTQSGERHGAIHEHEVFWSGHVASFQKLELPRPCRLLPALRPGAPPTAPAMNWLMLSSSTRIDSSAGRPSWMLGAVSLRTRSVRVPAFAPAIEVADIVLPDCCAQYPRIVASEPLVREI